MHNHEQINLKSRLKKTVSAVKHSNKFSYLDRVGAAPDQPTNPSNSQQMVRLTATPLYEHGYV